MLFEVCKLALAGGGDTSLHPAAPAQGLGKARGCVVCASGKEEILVQMLVTPKNLAIRTEPSESVFQERIRLWATEDRRLHKLQHRAGF